MDSYQLKSSKLELKPKRHHAFTVAIFIAGTLLPPIAVAMRFGIGSDFFLNLILTLCGYIPGHVHNFYIQNVRNNKNHARTPKWAQKAGLVDTSKIERNKKRSQWANAYNDRLPQSTHEGQEYEEGQIPDADSIGERSAKGKKKRTDSGRLWNADEERFYSENGRKNSIESGSGSTGGSGGGKRWKFNEADSNFADPGAIDKKKKKKKKDRWERTEDAYALPDDGKKKRKKSKKNRSTVGDGDFHTTPYDDPDRRSDFTGTSTNEMDVPEDPEGGGYGRPRPEDTAASSHQVNGRGNGGDELAHDF